MDSSVDDQDQWRVESEGETREEEILSCFSDGIDDMIFWAFRYFLGRRTIHTTFFAEGLARAFPELSEDVQLLIRRELEEAFEGKRSLGGEIDREAWTKVRDVYMEADHE